MTKEYVGLNTHLYCFTLKEETKYNQKKDKLSKTGKVTEVFVNNGYAFEHKLNKVID